MAEAGRRDYYSLTVWSLLQSPFGSLRVLLSALGRSTTLTAAIVKGIHGTCDDNTPAARPLARRSGSLRLSSSIRELRASYFPLFLITIHTSTHTHTHTHTHHTHTRRDQASIFPLLQEHPLAVALASLSPSLTPSFLRTASHSTVRDRARVMAA